VDNALPTVSTAEHRARLAWFAEHKGDVRPLVELAVDGMQLANRPKGIFKPADLQFALSVRTKRGGTGDHYADGEPVPLLDGGWALRYHQEGAGLADRDGLSANRGLMHCKDSQVPVGVLQEDGSIGRQTQYRVLGLATPVHWEDDYFYFVSLDAGVSGAAAIQELVARVDFEAQGANTIPGNDEDARRRVSREIVARQGQSRFRDALVSAYRGRCAITDCEATYVLEAAHLRPYLGPQTNTVNNGLLLRADIHTLLDLRLLAVEPDTRFVRLSRRLKGTQYEAFSGRPVADPVQVSQRPVRESLEFVWREFRAVEG
jgi:putative restriction endonuclease